MNEVQLRLTRCFAAVFPNLPSSEIAAASVERVRGWDSVAAATLVTAVEEEFGVEFDSDALETLTSFPAILEYLCRHSTET